MADAQLAYDNALGAAGGSPSQADVVAAETKFNEAQAAYNDDLTYYNMTADQHESWAAKVQMAKDIVADFDSRQGERDALYAAYMEIPLEKDAYAVGDKAQAALEANASSGGASS